MPIIINLQGFKQYWDKCSLTLKRNSLFFFSKDLVKFINETNDKLLYGEFANKKLQMLMTYLQYQQQRKQDYQLLNALEMLWNIENTQKDSTVNPIQKQKCGDINENASVSQKKLSNQQKKLNENDQTDNLDMVSIMSHTPYILDQETTQLEQFKSKESSNNFSTSKVQGYALAIKDEYLEKLLEICIEVTCSGFLECNPDSFILAREKLVIIEEEILFKSIQADQIKSWEDFEFMLGFIIENRLLQLYHSFLDSEYQRKWKKIDQDLTHMNENLSLNKEATILRPKVKKPKNKKKSNAKKQVKEAQSSQLELTQDEYKILNSVLKIQKYYRKFKSQKSNTTKVQRTNIKLYNSDKKRQKSLMFERFKVPINFKLDEFSLDFTSSFSDKSTSDQFISDEDTKSVKNRLSKKNLKPLELQYQRSRGSNINGQEEQMTQDVSKNTDQQPSGKFYWYLPNIMTMKPKPCRRILEESDDVSSESSLESEEDAETLEQYMQESYFQSYQMFETQARQQNHVVDVYNFNPNSLWQNIYMHNMQMDYLFGQTIAQMQPQQQYVQQNYYGGFQNQNNQINQGYQQYVPYHNNQ
eukprot:403352996